MMKKRTAMFWVMLVVMVQFLFAGTAMAANRVLRDGKDVSYSSNNMYHIDILVDAAYDYVLTFKQGDKGDHADMVLTKTWNPEASAPDSVTVKIKQNGDDYKTVTLSKDDNWTATVENLPYGDDYSYTVEEIVVDDQDWYSSIKSEVFSTVEERTDGTMVYTETDKQGNVSTIIFYYNEAAPKIVINNNTYEGSTNWKDVNGIPTLTFTYNNVEDGLTYTSVWTYDEENKTYTYTSHDYMKVTAINYVTYTNMTGVETLLYDRNNYVSEVTNRTEGSNNRSYFYYYELTDENRADQEFFSTNRAIPDMPAPGYSVNKNVNTPANGYSGKGSIIRVGFDYKYKFYDKFGVLTTWIDSIEEVFDTGSSDYTNLCGNKSVSSTMRGYDVTLHLSDAVYYLGDGPVVEYDVDILNTVTGELTVSKVVEATTSDETFQMTITLDKLNDQYITGTFDAVLTDAAGVQSNTTVTFNANGQATVRMKASESITISGLPTGVTYTVEEAIDADEWAVEYSPATGVVGAADVKVTNIWIGERHETLVISKMLAAGAPETDREFTIQVTVTGDEINAGGDASFTAVTQAHRYDKDGKEIAGRSPFNVSFVDGVATFSIKADETVKITNMPEGANYDVVEIGAGAYTGTVSNATKSTVTVDGQMVAEVAFVVTNEYTPASLAITKLCDVPYGSASFKVRITLSDTTVNGAFAYNCLNGDEGAITFLDGVGEVSITAGDTLTIVGLPYGITATVEEIDAEGYTATYQVGAADATAAPQDVELEANETAAVTITNTRTTGDLSITKLIVSPLTSCQDHAYDFRVLLSNNNINDYYDVGVTNRNGARTEEPTAVKFTNGVADVTLYAGETLTILNLPTGVDYEVRELVDSTRYDSQVTDGFANGAITTADAAVTFTNTHRTTLLEINKHVVSVNEDDFDQAFEFTITLSGADLVTTQFDAYRTGSTETVIFNKKDGDYVATVTLKHDETLRIIGLPIGLTYTVDEVLYGDFDTSIAGEASGRLTSNAASVTFTNTKNRAPISVEKKFSGLADSYIEHMMVQLIFTEVDENGNAVTDAASYMWELRQNNGWQQEIADFPAGYYKVTEEVYGLPEGYELQSAVLTKDGETVIGDVVEIEANKESAIALVLTNTYTHVEIISPTSVMIPIEKTVEATGTVVPGQTTFYFGAEWNNLNNINVSVSFVDAAGNTMGQVKQTSANTYSITVNGEGTVRGYIVIRGYAEALDGFTLTTWEKLTPYGSVQEAENAHWYYDQTATSELRYTVRLMATSKSSLSYSITQDGSPKAAVAFRNIYEETIIPDIPQTGDEADLMLWTAMALLSVAGMLVVLSKHRKVHAS